MLTLIEYGVQFGPPNFSAEQHGEEVKPLVTIYAVAVVNAANLESFKSGLQNALWKRPALNDSERMDEDGKTVHELVCRFPTAKAVKFSDKFPGYALVVHKSELFDETKDWPEVTICNVSIEPQNGGTASVRFGIQARGEELEWWVQMMNRAASITLTPPKDEPLPKGHPDAPAPDDGPQAPIGQGKPPVADPMAGTPLQTVDTTAMFGTESSITGPAGPLMDAIKQRVKQKRPSRTAA